MKLVAGNSNRPLAEAIATYLDSPLARCIVRRFADKEIFVEVQENVRGEDVFIVQSTAANEREGHDVCVKILDASGETTKERWLTEHEEGEQGAYPRIARYGDHIFVAWHDSSDSRGLQQIVLDRSLETVVPRTTSRDVKLSPYDDLHNLDNGAIVWAVPQGRNKIRVYRIDQPEVLEKALVKRNASAAAE